MPAAEVVRQIRDALDALKDADPDETRLPEVLALSERLVGAMNLFFGSFDKDVYGEFRYLSDYIKRTRDEIAALSPNDIRSERLPSAGAELDAVVGDTERATHAIMEEAEQVLAASPDDAGAYKAGVDAAMMRIIEACAFQDITGQRVKKVVATLEHIEARISRFAAAVGDFAETAETETDKQRWEKENLLHGPQLNGPEVSQDAIDALFEESGSSGPLDQDDIDALFE